MKKLYTLLVLAFLSVNASSQEAHLNFERYLIAEEQAPMIIKDYLNPAMVGMMNTASSAWYSTAETHKRFGFDITFNFVGSFIPDDQLTFDINKYVDSPNNKNNFAVDGNPNRLPTIFGTKDISPSITSAIFNPHDNMDVNMDVNMNAPNGIGLDPAVAPTAMMQAGLGIGWGTEVKFRFMPKVGAAGYEAGLWGLAIQHDVAQYIPVIKKLPISISVLGGYTKSSATWEFNDDDNEWFTDTNQHTNFEVQNYTFQLLASTNIPIINAYAGIGYNSSKASFQMHGKYLVDDENGNSNYVDPASGDWKSSGFTGTLGVRLSIAFFKIFADYTFKEYNTASAGISFSFR